MGDEEAKKEALMSLQFDSQKVYARLFRRAFSGCPQCLASFVSTDAYGEVRNASKFWKELLRREPSMFSKTNRYRIEELGKSPRVDATWIKYNPTHQSGRRGVLHHHHHHIDLGPIAVPLPQMIDQLWSGSLH